ncbi:IPT/TIG domain-containing protein [Streptomyces sp. NPDC058572]|uniref:IPT/TIG domain-containing protein n=1 Tax=Streptomyces sp. NPDC058572 TaxID=3346546 RepID=UPI00366A5064
MPISPSQGSTGGGTPVTITGTNLAGATAVRFGGKSATITGNTPTSVSALSPAGAGAVDTSVITPGGTSEPVQFFYVQPPVVLSVSPASGAVAGGDTITITGRNLATANSVEFGGTPVVPTVVSDTEITVVTPATAEDEVALVVHTRGGIFDDLAFAFVDPPTMTAFTPVTGTTAGGTLVNITGTNLATATDVTFGGVSATSFAALSDTQVAAITPPHGLGAVAVAITTTGGSDAAPLTYLYVL